MGISVVYYLALLFFNYCVKMAKIGITLNHISIGKSSLMGKNIAGAKEKSSVLIIEIDGRTFCRCLGVQEIEITDRNIYGHNCRPVRVPDIYQRDEKGNGLAGGAILEWQIGEKAVTAIDAAPGDRRGGGERGKDFRFLNRQKSQAFLVLGDIFFADAEAVSVPLK